MANGWPLFSPAVRALSLTRKRRSASGDIRGSRGPIEVTRRLGSPAAARRLVCTRRDRLPDRACRHRGRRSRSRTIERTLLDIAATLDRAASWSTMLVVAADRSRRLRWPRSYRRDSPSRAVGRKGRQRRFGALCEQADPRRRRRASLTYRGRLPRRSAAKAELDDCPQRATSWSRAGSSTSTGPKERLIVETDSYGYHARPSRPSRRTTSRPST